MTATIPQLLARRKNLAECRAAHLRAAAAARARARARWFRHAATAVPRNFFSWLRSRTGVQRSSQLAFDGVAFYGNVDDVDKCARDRYARPMQAHATGLGPSCDALVERTCRHFAPPAFAWTTLSGGRLRRAFKAQCHKAAGADGLPGALLAMLPDRALAALAAILSSIELQGCWPDSLTTASMVLIPKPDADDWAQLELKGRPLTIYSCVYRAWSTLRARELALWLSKWTPPALVACMPGRSATDIWMKIAVSTEASRHGATPLAGAVFDLQNAFHILPRGLVMKVLRAWGVHGAPLEAWLLHAAATVRVFSWEGGLGAPWLTSRGFGQGCALSTVAMTAVAAAWFASVNHGPMAVDCMAYSDNWEILADTAEAVRAAVAATAQFAHDADILLSAPKSWAWATQPALRHALADLRMDGEPLSLVCSQRDLGATLHYGGSRSAAVRGVRMARAELQAAVCEVAPVAKPFKEQLAGTVILAGAMYAVETTPWPWTAVRALRSLLVRAVWGKSFGYAAPEILLSLQRAPLEPAYRIVCARLRWLWPVSYTISEPTRPY